MRQDGATARIGQLLVDANYGKSTETVKRWCRETAHAAVTEICAAADTKLAAKIVRKLG